MSWKTTGAEVLVSDSYTTSLAANYEVGSMICKVYATTHTVVKEYRGMTKAAAQTLAGQNSSCNKTAFRTTHGTSWAVVPALIGTEKSAQARRTNESGGYTVTVTENTTTATASWESGTSA